MIRWVGTVAAVVVLVAAYRWLPDAGPTAPGVGVRWAIGLAVVAVVLAWQLRAVARSRHPVRRGLRALVLVVALFLLVFAKSYQLLALAHDGAFSEPLDEDDALYFTVTVFATVGFGDLVPLSPPARLLVTLQMLGDLVVVGGAARLLVIVARNRSRGLGTGPPGQQQRHAEPRDRHAPEHGQGRGEGPPVRRPGHDGPGQRGTE
ncbi:two pore domain potassium channel family protein [Saccharothrix syringae]|uniref:Two pore domain potassium channel family protein n=1 Tax=Saccharothrix syringae TaxID=103733 RepID=A0A5Q0H1J4_SACSY|nr:two pore domain potassium channel family protein [Saccharothrix syringae]